MIGNKIFRDWTEEDTRMVASIEQRAIVILLVAALAIACVPSAAGSVLTADSYAIGLEEFRWTSFPLGVLVDMNQWSLPGYVFAVREALDSWMKSIWNYTDSYNDTSLPSISYDLFVSNVNATNDYDVLVTFTPYRIPPGSGTVGLTTYEWNPLTHEPIPPIIVNVTTSSATATHLFVKNVVMHEFGHALGLGHSSSSNTLNGPELMYYTSSRNEVVYPSTLDVYGLTALYGGVFGQSVQLPSNIPYIMLAEGTVSPPPPAVNPWIDYNKYLPVIAVLLILIVAAIVLGQVGREKKPEEPTQSLPPPSPTIQVML